MRQVQRVLAVALELVIASRHEAATHRRRRAEQIQQQPRFAPEVPDQAEVVVVVEPMRPGEVVVDAGDRLHAAPVAMRQAHAIDALGAADIRRPVAPDRDRIVGGKPARHARRPQELVADGAIDRLVDLDELGQARLRIGMDAGDQLDLRFAEVGGHQRMRQRRAERRGMRRRRQRTVGPHAQAFLLDAPAQVGERLRCKRVEALMQQRRRIGEQRLAPEKWGGPTSPRTIGGGAALTAPVRGSQCTRVWAARAKMRRTETMLRLA